MRTSQYFISTLKETPSDAVITSHQLMIRAGMIRKLASGLYTWLPIGLKVLKKIEQIIRKEMNQAGALEILMPMVQPAELWQESGRWQDYGAELLRCYDRHHREFVLGPTHEEVVTDIIRNEIKSYKQLPLHFYQIQTKFRDEMRPRFGVMRSREFLMKDGYSFHISEEDLKNEFNTIHKTYCRIFDHLELEYRAVEADNGSIGGTGSREFHVLADSGEDAIVFSDASHYASNIESAKTLPSIVKRTSPTQPMLKKATPNIKTITQLTNHFNILPDQIIKTLIVKANNTIEKGFIALVVRGDHELNEIKAAALPEVAEPFTFATEEEIYHCTGAHTGSLGVINTSLLCIVDHSVVSMSDFVMGANHDDQHYFGVNWGRDCSYNRSEDLRNIVAGDPSPCGKGHIFIKRGIEIGHIFQLGTKYSETMKAEALSAKGKKNKLHMGCYGIGISRIVGALIEQKHDDKGIIWPQCIAPFTVILVPLKIEKSEAVQKVAEELYNHLLIKNHIDVLLDDRKVSPGVKLADAELLGIPHRVVISDRGLKNHQVEYQYRGTTHKEDIRKDAILTFLMDKILPKPNN